MPNKPTAEPLIVDPKIAAAIDRYCQRTKLMCTDEFLDRAILCYLIAQKTIEAYQAIQESGLLGDDDDHFALVPDEVKP